MPLSKYNTYVKFYLCICKYCKVHIKVQKFIVWQKFWLDYISKKNFFFRTAWRLRFHIKISVTHYIFPLFLQKAIESLQALFKKTCSIEADQVTEDIDEAVELEGRPQINQLEREQSKKRKWRRTGMVKLSNDFRDDQWNKDRNLRFLSIRLFFFLLLTNFEG